MPRHLRHIVERPDWARSKTTTEYVRRNSVDKVTADRGGEQNAVFQATNISAFDRVAHRMGYNPETSSDDGLSEDYLPERVRHTSTNMKTGETKVTWGPRFSLKRKAEEIADRSTLGKFVQGAKREREGLKESKRGELMARIERLGKLAADNPELVKPPKRDKKVSYAGGTVTPPPPPKGRTYSGFLVSPPPRKRRSFLGCGLPEGYKGLDGLGFKPRKKRDKERRELKPGCRYPSPLPKSRFSPGCSYPSPPKPPKFKPYWNEKDSD